MMQRLGNAELLRRHLISLCSAVSSHSASALPWDAGR